MTAASLVDQYFAILDEVGVENFHNPSLDALRMRMTDRELLAVQARLEAEAKAALQETDELERYGQIKFGAKDLEAIARPGAIAGWA